jgi:outer membrane protein W
MFSPGSGSNSNIMTRLSRLIALAVFAATFGVTAVASADSHCTINEFGGPRRFAENSADTEGDLQNVFREHRDDITRLLQQAGWQGNAEDLFGAVAAGDATEKDFPPGTPFQWMMMRYKGVAQMAVDKCWGGKEAFPGWSLVVESNGRRWNFVVPKACGNLALSGSEALPPVETGPSEAEIAAAEAAAKAKAAAKAEAAAVAAAAAKAEAEAAAAAAAAEEATAMAAADAEAARLARTSSSTGCVVRGFFGNSNGSDEFNETENAGTADETRTHASIGSGSGGGLEGECMVTPRLGVAIGLLSFEQDGDFMFDDAEVWEMDSDDIGWTAVTAGVNYHFSKHNSKFDLFAGPFLGFVTWDSADFTILGETTKMQFDDDFTWGVQVGIGFPVRKGFGFYGGIRYFDLSAKVQGEPVEFDINPIVFAAGLTYRFK